MIAVNHFLIKSINDFDAINWYLICSMPWKPKKEKGPLQIEKSKASILYDKEGRTYIDCISGVSHGKKPSLLYLIIGKGYIHIIWANDNC